jgi:hypothetical protein
MIRADNAQSLYFLLAGVTAVTTVASEPDFIVGSRRRRSDDETPSA